MTGKNRETLSLNIDILLQDLRVIFNGASWEAVESRARVLFDYARNTEEGIIVELGTYMGYGAFSLAYGALSGNNSTVYTLDDFIDRTGWAGEPYKPEDEKLFYNNFKQMSFYKDMRLYHVRMDADKGSEMFSGVGLLFIDTSPAFTYEMFLKWEPCVMTGGVVLFRDTLTHSLGYDLLLAKIAKDKWDVIPEPNRYFTAIRKRAQDG